MCAHGCITINYLEYILVNYECYQHDLPVLPS